MQTNGIEYFKYVGGQWVWFGKTMGDGVTPIEDVRMLNYIAPALQAVGMQYLGQAQPATLNNAVMQGYANAIKTFLNPLTQGATPKITGFSVDLSPNTVTTIQQHTLIGSISVQTLSAIWYVLNILQVGNAVQITPAAAVL